MSLEGESIDRQLTLTPRRSGWNPQPASNAAISHATPAGSTAATSKRLGDGLSRRIRLWRATTIRRKRRPILGGGIIGLEMGTVDSKLGERLDMVEMLDGRMQVADRDPGRHPAAPLPTAATKASPSCCSTTALRRMATARSWAAAWSARMRAT